MKRLYVLIAAIMLLSSCAPESSPSAALPPDWNNTASPSVETPGVPSLTPSASPSQSPSQSPLQSPSEAPSEAPPSPSDLPAVSPGEDPMLDKTYEGATLQVRQSWPERDAGNGAVVFELDEGCAVMLQQVEHGGDKSDAELLRSVMEALAPGGEHPEAARDGFPGMSCRYVRDSGSGKLQCISYAYVHGGVLTTISILLASEYMDAAEATLQPILDSLKLSKV